MDEPSGKAESGLKTITIMTSFATIIYCLLALGFGVFVGAAWGLSRHVELLDWLEARTIRRWMAAMQSLGYEQWRIDQVLEQMGQRIMVNIPPPPEPPKKEPSLDDQLRKLNLVAAWHWTVAVEDFELVQQLCINHSDKIHAAAKSHEHHALEEVASMIRTEWIALTTHDYGLRDPYVVINPKNYDEDGIVFVLFEVK